jgi:3-methylcrotonyl-CoA carboxylase beta subunit
MSRQGHPQIACVMGSCTAGGAYVPAMSDETVIVRRGEPGHHLPGRPAAGEGRDGRGHQRRGARRRRRPRTPQVGVVDHVAANDEHALEIVRSIIGNLNTVKRVDMDQSREPKAPLL